MQEQGKLVQTPCVLKKARASLNKFVKIEAEKVLTSCCKCLKGLSTMGREITRE